MNVVVRHAYKHEAPAIARLTVALLREIMARTQARHFDVNATEIETLCARYLESGAYTVLIAELKSELIGFATLCESHALYAGGAFGIVQEFYVAPSYRSRALGRELLARARNEARNRGWKRLELCTPPLPAFERTVAFYEDNGFEVTGGRKMRCALQ